MKYHKTGSGKKTQDFFKKTGTQEERINGGEEHLYIFVESDLEPIILLAFVQTVT